MKSNGEVREEENYLGEKRGRGRYSRIRKDRRGWNGMEVRGYEKGDGVGEKKVYGERK